MTHKSKAFLNHTDWNQKGISGQFRFIIRMAVACHDQGIPYDVDWTITKSPVERPNDWQFTLSLQCSNSGSLPVPKRLKRDPETIRRVQWKPKMLEASYILNAYYGGAGSDARWRSGFVIMHPSGLQLVRPGESETGEMECNDGEDLRQGWLIAHTLSGKGMGLELSFSRAVGALEMAATSSVDWHQTLDQLASDPGVKQVGIDLHLAYGSTWQKQDARQRQNQYQEVAA